MSLCFAGVRQRRVERAKSGRVLHGVDAPAGGRGPPAAPRESQRQQAKAAQPVHQARAGAERAVCAGQSEAGHASLRWRLCAFLPQWEVDVDIQTKFVKVNKN